MVSLLLALLLQGAAPEGAPANPPGVQPDWIRRPTAMDFANNYPAAAARKRLAGRVVMSCNVSAEGKMAGCSILEEYPADVGFGEAVLKMSSLFLMRPMTKNGQPVDGGTVRIPMRFVISPGESIDGLSAMLGCYGQAAAAAEKEPGNREVAGAYAFFAAQAAMRQGETTATPAMFEANLAEARHAAVAAGAAPSGSVPGLKTCLDLYRAQGAKPK